MGKITGKPDQFDGKNPWVSGSDFPLNQSSEWSVITPQNARGSPSRWGYHKESGQWRAAPKTMRKLGSF